MRRERLLCLSYATLEQLASRMEVEYEEGADREELVEAILEVIKENREEWERQTSAPLRFEEKKFDLPPEDVLELTEPEDAHFPESYSKTRIRMLLRDPEWAFLYWDLNPNLTDGYQLANDFSGLHLRVLELSSPNISATKDPLDSFDIDVRLDDRSWYLNLPNQGTFYAVQLVASSGSRVEVLAVSNVVPVPRLVVPELAASSARSAPIMKLSGIENAGRQAASLDSGRRGMSLIGELYGRN